MNVHQACINDEASKAEASETNPATQSVNLDDSSPHTPAQQPRSEAVTHSPQPPVTDIEPNLSRADYSNNELALELPAECLHIQKTAKGIDPLSQQCIGRDVKSLSKKLKLFIREPRHTTHRHRVSHQHNGCNSTIIDSDGNENNKKTNTMQPPFLISTNCTALQRHKPLKK